MMDAVLERTDGRVVFDYDITAEVRQGYWGRLDTGPLFVENRYTDWHGYWPHTTLRNVWSLAHYVDPSRLRMEFLNNARNDEQYADDPLAPSRYRADYLFATVMLTSPLGWFEVSNLPAGYVDALRPLVDTWKAHRERLHRGHVVPIGAKPDGVAWTGFLVLEGDGGYVLAFREANPANTSRFDVPARDETAVERLGGEGQAALRDGVLEVSVPEPLRFFFGRFGDAG
jgi:alpha-galactosidase